MYIHKHIQKNRQIHRQATSIGVIYEGYWYPTFWTEGYRTLYFSWRKGEEYAVNRGDERILNYNKTVFGWISVPSQIDELKIAHTGPES